MIHIEARFTLSDQRVVCAEKMNTLARLQEILVLVLRKVHKDVLNRPSPSYTIKIRILDDQEVEILLLKSQSLLSMIHIKYRWTENEIAFFSTDKREISDWKKVIGEMVAKIPK